MLVELIKRGRNMKFIVVFLLVILLGACDGVESENNIADGNVTDEEAEVMQELWCDYNKDRDFAKEQCDEYWNE